VSPLAYPMVEESVFRTVYPAETCGHDPDEPDNQSVGSESLTYTASSESNRSMLLGSYTSASSSSSSSSSSNCTGIIGKLEPDDQSVGSETLPSTASSESNQSMLLGSCRTASSSSGSSTAIFGKLEPTSRVAKLALNYQKEPITRGRLFQIAPPNHGQSEGLDNGHSSTAGKREFSRGEKMEYFNEKVHSWIPATVMGRNTNGTYQLDCRQYASVNKMRSVTHTPPPPTPVAARVSTGQGRWWLPKATPIFKSGEFVEYYSRARGGWVNSMVLGNNSDGTYRLDCKRKAKAKDLRSQTPNGGAFQTKILDHSSFQTRVSGGAFSTKVDILS